MGALSTEPTVDIKGDRVSPEVQRAFGVLVQNLPRQHELAVADLPNQLLPTGFKAFSTDPITKYNIPHTSEWTWRQSNGKVVIALSATDNVTIAKLSPRKTSSATCKQPSFKVWIFEVRSASSGSLWFLWCEKGEPVPITLRLAGSMAFQSHSSFLKLPKLPTYTTTSTYTSSTTYSYGSAQAVPTSPPVAYAPAAKPGFEPTIPAAMELEVPQVAPLEPLPFNDFSSVSTGSFTKSLFTGIGEGLSQSDLTFLAEYM
eukprot:CAMPEP_0114633724 /NCGR_PEP_ID=MMETSP0168-20121206/15601_1 /TAXON_ID=95228 ORGANISM="Vannella sp., Strain DIVA3 517/6/12" /NCGR_SAMPLE_ID=MMETSP0168 /ASSEMBLY_ACC=CAM_ASM_000044 /LENGTH=257 /DNA_ID=CAMNT_0001845381 /DNA_START=8 /DNA_END=781 /DNA_ORIENTATION=-